VSDPLSEPNGLIKARDLILIIRVVLLLFAFFLPFEEIWKELWGVDTMLKPYRIFAFLAICLGINKLIKARWDKYDKYFAVILIVGALLAFFWLMYDRGNIQWVTQELLLLSFSFIMYLLIKRLDLTEKEINMALFLFVIACCMNAFYCLYQVIALGIVFRPHGLSRTPSQFALFNGIALLFLISRFVYADRSYSWLEGLLFVLSSLLLLFTILLSGTRSVMLGIIIALIAIFIILSKRSKRARVFMLMMWVAGIALITSIIIQFSAMQDTWQVLLDRLEPTTVASGAGRLDIWGLSWFIMKDFYFIGAGTAGFLIACIPYLPRLGYFNPAELLVEDKGLVLHNLYLNILVDYGPLCFVLFIWTVYMILSSLIRLSKHNKYFSPLLPAVMSLFLLIIVQGFFDDSLNGVTFWIVLSLATYLASNEQVNFIIEE